HGLPSARIEVRDDLDAFRLPLAGRFLRPAFTLPPAFTLFRGALHVQAEDPGRPPPHDHLDDRMAARVAPLSRRDDEAALGERVRVIATGILRAANETLSVRPVTNHQFSIPEIGRASWR